ncbi:Ltp family lipoprotein [Staphylococcus epidermidis]|nr:Ltp family lipoprotein [Staphylococcus epidermidis]
MINSTLQQNPQYAIDHLEADYEKNALEKAKSYAKDMHMSNDSIYDLLVSNYGEKFTESEAKYAIEHLDN